MSSSRGTSRLAGARDPADPRRERSFSSRRMACQSSCQKGRCRSHRSPKIGSVSEELVHHPSNAIHRHLKRFRDLHRIAHRHAGPDVDVEKTPVPAEDLFVRQVVVHVGRMDVEDFVAKEGEGFSGFQRIEREKTAELHVFLDGGARHVESFQRIVAHQGNAAEDSNWYRVGGRGREICRRTCRIAYRCRHPAPE